MPVSKEIQEAVAHELRKTLPMMDIDAIKKELLDWLQLLKFPGFATSKSWEESLVIVPRGADCQELESGVKLRIALTLYTTANRYLLSILECFHPEARGTYLFTVHTNWDDTEKRQVKRIESHYDRVFKDNLKARHIIWAQTFRSDELHEALDSGAVAILSHELTGSPPVKQTGTPIFRPPYSTPSFIEKSDEDNFIL